MFCDMIDQIIDYIKTHPLVPKDIVVRGFIIDSETGALEEINCWTTCSTKAVKQLESML